MRKKVFFSIGILLLCLAAYAFYLYNKPHMDVSSIAPAFTISAAELYAAYEQNEKGANKKFLDKILLVQGTINDVSKTDSTLTVLLESNNVMGGVSCNIASSKMITINIKNGEHISIKGRCTGFLADVTLTDCVVER